MLRPEASHTLRWTINVCNDVIERIDAQLIVTLGGGRGCTTTPECSLEVWALGEQGEELVYCHASVMHRLPSVAEVEWLGRTSHRAASSRVRGWRCVAAPNPTAASGNWALSASPQLPRADGWLTVAEAVLGLIAGLLCLFGVGIVELEVMDDGSGRLAQWYLNAGFKRVAQYDWARDIFRKSLWMAAPVSTLAQQYAPTAWLKALVPPDFDAQTWLSSEVLKFWLERARLGRLPRWSWSVKWPTRADLHMEVSQCASSKKIGACLMLDAFISGACVVLRTPSELVGCRCTLQLQKRVLTVLWLGRRDSQPANAAVRGKKTYTAGCPNAAHGHPVPLECMVTCAVGLLGAMATAACWFGATTVRIHARDNGSGKLIRYLEGLGFADTSTICPAESGNSKNTWLYAQCQFVAQHCCPLEWHAQLLTAEDLNRFTTVCFNRVQLLEEDACELQEVREQNLQDALERRNSTKRDKQDHTLTRSMSDATISRHRGIEVSAAGRRGRVILEPLVR